MADSVSLSLFGGALLPSEIGLHFLSKSVAQMASEDLLHVPSLNI